MKLLIFLVLFIVFIQASGNLPLCPTTPCDNYVNGHRVRICHQANSHKFIRITVDKSSIKKHFENHGDFFPGENRTTCRCKPCVECQRDRDCPGDGDPCTEEICRNYNCSRRKLAFIAERSCLLLQPGPI